MSSLEAPFWADLVRRAPFGVCVVDPELRLVEGNVAAARMLGLVDRPQRGEAVDNFFDDASKLALRDAIERIAARPDDDGRAARLRLMRSDGTSIALRIVGFPQPEASEATFAIYFDDERDAAALMRELRFTQQKVRALLQGLSQGVLVETGNRKVELVNSEFCRLWSMNIGPDLLIGGDCTEAAEIAAESTKDPDGFLHAIEVCIETRRPHTDVRVDLIDGRTLLMSYIPVEVTGSHGHLWLYREAPTERPMVLSEHRHDQHDSRFDTTAGVLDRDAVLDAAEIVLRETLKSAEPFSVGIVDLDEFKKFNHAHGHRVGDELLRELGRRLRSIVRAHDHVGRLSGERFVVLLPRTTPAAATQLADRIRRELALPHGRFEVPTVSVGVASLQHGIGHQNAAPHQIRDRLLNNAGRALERAKLSGRNRVIHVDGHHEDIL